MNIPDAALLRKAIEIKTELEDLERQLEELLHVSSIETSGETSARISKTKKKALDTIPTKARHIFQGNNPEVTLANDPSTSHTTEVSDPSEKKDEAELSHEVVGMLSSSKPHQETVLLVEEQSEAPSSAPEKEDPSSAPEKEDPSSAPEKEDPSSLDPTYPTSRESYYSSPEAVSEASTLPEGLVDDTTAAPEASAETPTSSQNEPHALVF
jgi:hypothetical protein